MSTTYPAPTTLQKTLALLVHSFTASGIVCGFMSVLAISAHNWRTATLWLLAAFAIDGIDGTFARAARVKEVLPWFDGKMMDCVIDFTNYAVVPAYFIYTSGILPDAYALSGAIVILLVSALYYGKSGMVTPDLYFEGFPVMWNAVAFYLFFVFHFSPIVNWILVLVLAILHFVPIKYLYPSRTQAHFVPNVAISVALLVALTYVVAAYPHTQSTLYQAARYTCIVCLAYFAYMSIHSTYLAPSPKS